MKDLLIALTYLFAFFLGMILTTHVAAGVWQAVFLQTDRGWENRMNIVSLERSSEVNGSFVLGFGGVSTDVVYYAYRDLGNGAYELIKKPLRNYNGEGKTYIQEINNESPGFVRSKICNKEEGVFTEYFKCNIYNKIVVPTGTIKKEFRG